MVDEEKRERLKKLLPGSVFNPLVSSDIDLDDPKIFHAVELTASVLRRAEQEGK